MRKIPLTNGGDAIVDDEDYYCLSTYRWQQHSNGYASRCTREKTILMHRYIMGEPDGKWVHHINENKLDNRKDNLVVCCAKDNFGARGIARNNKSGYKGVCWDNCRKKWKSYITKDDKLVNLGRFDTIEEAATVYNEAAKEHFGEFAKLNEV